MTAIEINKIRLSLLRWKHQDGGIIKAVQGTKSYYRSSVLEKPESNDYDITANLQLSMPEVINYPAVRIEKVEGVIPEGFPIHATNNRRYTAYDRISSDLQDILNAFVDEGIDIKVTSAFREGAMTKQGRPSKHGLGEAVDIVPVDGDFNKLDRLIKKNPRIKRLMQMKGYGVIREDNDEMLKKTGGTGYHFHIGTDNMAKKYWLS